MSAPVPILNIDTSGTAFGAAPTYTDRTAYLLTGSSYPVDITFGRQDRDEEVVPSTMTFYLKNDTGFWTPGNAAAPAAWDIGCPVQLKLTVGGTDYTRFTGLVDSIEPTWPGGVQSWSVVKVTATDVSARLGLAKPLESFLVQEMLADAPLYLYKLDEETGATSAADSSGNSAAVATIVNAAAGAWPVEFGQTMPALDAMSGASFGDLNTSTLASALSLPVTSIPGSGGRTWEFWFVGPSSAPAGVSPTILWTSNPDGTVFESLVITASTGVLTYNLTDGPTTHTLASTASVCDAGLHQAVVTLSADRKTSTLYVDGASVATTTSGSALSASSFGHVVLTEVGGQTQNYGSLTAPRATSGATFPGTLGCAAYFEPILSAARILAHYEATVGTLTERSDLRFARIAAYAGVTTSGLPTGVATMGGQQLSGKSAIEALQDVARTEGSVAYVTTAGALTFGGRNSRYHEAAGLSVTPSDVQPYGIRRDRQGLTNQITVGRPGGASQVVKDATSQTVVGRFDGGSFTVAPSTDDDAYQAASWRVQTRKSPLTRLPNLTINLLGAGTSLAQSCLSVAIGTKVAMSSLPSQSPASSVNLFVEGWTERVAYDDWSITFNTSPVTLEDSVLVLDDATFGVTDSTNVLAL